jgi:hypothetical protein
MWVVNADVGRVCARLGPGCLGWMVSVTREGVRYAGELAISSRG